MVACPECGIDLTDPDKKHACTPATAASRGRPRLIPNRMRMEEAAKNRI